MREDLDATIHDLRRTSKQSTGDFEMLHRSTEKWWHAFSFYHVYKKNSLRAEWTAVRLLLSEVISHAYLNTVLKNMQIDNSKFQIPPNAQSMTTLKKSLAMDSITDPSEIWRSFGIEDVGVKEHKTMFDLLQSGKVKGESAERFFLYVSIGCTPQMIEDYIELPYSFLLQIACTINEAKTL